MVLDAEAAWLAVKARDARFDGRFFVGVTSTRIYCRPVCRVRTPRRENCRWFETPAQAEAAAFRPCLKCRPEIAPGLAHTDSSRTLADAAARMVEQAVQQGSAIELTALAARLGVTDRHLRRIFQARHGVAPRDYLATQRLLLAKQLLTDTRQPVSQVALASGYDSLRRFNAAFRERYRLNPTQLRRERAGAGTRRVVGVSVGDEAPTLRLAYRPPFDAAALLRFFAVRALAGVEQVDGAVLRRTLACERPDGSRVAGWLAVRFEPSRHEVHLSTAPAFAPMLGALMQRVRRALDLDADPAPIEVSLASLAGLAVSADAAAAVAGMPRLQHATGTRLPGAFDGFETAARIVLGQQVTLQAARTLAQRLVDRHGEPVHTPWPALNRLFPSAATIAAADAGAIGELGIVRQRVVALQALAREVAAGRIELAPGAPLAPALDALGALPGIGAWTVQMIAMRVLGWPDAWPATDVGLLKAAALPPAVGTGAPPRATARELEATAAAWRPWRAYAVVRLWQRLEETA